MVFGLLGWLYVAACAAVRPQDMSLPITVLVPLRRDTFGTVCFAVSALCAAGLQIGTGRLLAVRPPGVGVAPALLRTVAGYAGLAWAYLCVNSLTHPATIGVRLTHFSPFPAEGTAATWCFLLCGASFLALRLRGSVRGR
jgi:hypothetical protein